MAYRNNIIRKYYTSVASFISDLTDELVAAGWTLHDDQSGSSYKVFKSGANINGLYGYMKVSWTTSAITCTAYLYWNNSTHTGYGKAYDAYGYPFSESGTYAWIYANEQRFFFVTLIGSTYRVDGAGHFTPFTNVFTTLTANASSGSNVQITVANTAGFIAGQKYFIVDNSTGMRDWVQIASINDSTHMTIASLPNSYTSGSGFGTTPIVFVNFFYASGTGWVCMQVVSTQMSGSGACLVSSDGCAIFANLYPQDTPDNYSHQLNILEPVILVSKNYFAPYIYATIGFADDFVFRTSLSLANEDACLYTDGKLRHDSGTSSGSNGTNTLNDTSKNWTTNQFQNKIVYISGGNGSGQIRKISSNTATQLTVSVDWAVTPDSTSTYVIVDEAYRYFKDASSNWFFVFREGA